MFGPGSLPFKQLFEFDPPASSQRGKDVLAASVGAFRLSAVYSRDRERLIRRQFTGKADLNLHDPENGLAVVMISEIASMTLAYVRSTGHEVSVSELQRPNLLVPVTGTLSCRNEQMLYEGKNEPWLLLGRGARETTVVPDRDGVFQAFVISLPPKFLGKLLTSLEAGGGMAWGDASKEDDQQLARLTLALAAQVSLSGFGGTAMDAPVADAWTTVVMEQINACLGGRVRGTADQAYDLPVIRVRKAEGFMQERLNEIGNLGDIADYVGVSERTLQTAFRKVRGATPMQVLSQARLQRARHALRDRDGPETVSEVCSMCGIEHHGRFSKHYKEAFGEYPVVTLSSRGTR